MSSRNASSSVGEPETGRRLRPAWPERTVGGAAPPGAEDVSTDGPVTAGAATGDLGAAGPTPDETGRSLFRYVTVDEWRDYRAVMAVFAGTFFSEFTPDEVAVTLAAGGHPLEATTVADRLDSLCRWGNLTVSSTVGNPSSLADYYKRRNRYLITRAGQEVHQLVEGVLSRVDEVRDVATGRLRALLEALEALAATDLGQVDPVRLSDLVGAVFDPHEAFTSEITQFFAAINQWQSRYDLSADEFAFFAEVLVGYVAERLDEIERTARPIGRLLDSLSASVPAIIDRASRGLATRVEDAGLETRVAVTQRSGSRPEDWQHLEAWFVTRSGHPSRIDQLGRDAVAAIRTLTLNLTRLSRVGVGASSRRADFLRLARFLADAEPDDTHRVAVAALGLQATNHYGVPSADADDPVSTAVSWWAAPRATVPVSIRARGDTTNRGRPSPIPDRTQAQRLVRLRREQEQEARRRVDAELLDHPQLNGAELSAAGFQRLQEVVGRALHLLDTSAPQLTRADGLITCTLARTPGADTTIACPDGRLTLRDLHVAVKPTPDATDGAPRGAHTVDTVDAGARGGVRAAADGADGAHRGI